jgi:hypothetical protein
MSTTDPILTAREIAVELRCSKSQAYKLLNGEVKGVAKIPTLPLGRKKVVRRSSFEAWKRAVEIGAILSPDSEKTNSVGAVH